MENETLEELIARWRRSVAPDGGYNSQETTSASYDVVRLNCADELAPIIAGLRGLRDELRVLTNKYSRGPETVKAGAVAGDFHVLLTRLTALLDRPATADQTDAKR